MSQGVGVKSVPAATFTDMGHSARGGHGERAWQGCSVADRSGAAPMWSCQEGSFSLKSLLSGEGDNGAGGREVTHHPPGLCRHGAGHLARARGFMGLPAPDQRLKRCTRDPGREARGFSG